MSRSHKVIAFAMCAILALSALALSGCAKKIEGTPSECIKQVRSLETDESAKVIATGYVLTNITRYDDFGDGSYSITISDDGTYDKAITCFFDSEPKYKTGKVTIEGDLDSDLTSTSTIYLFNCTEK